MPEIKPLHVALVWNHHQPYYKDEARDLYLMPWVRLHTTRNYYQMAAILEDYPLLRVTFNLTPVLVRQMEDYAAGAEDLYLLAAGDAESLGEEERRFLLTHYFDLNAETSIEPYPGYRELWELRGRDNRAETVGEALARFTAADYRDLQVWFHLVWTDPELREKDPFLRRLMEKGRGFTEEEKKGLLRRHREIIRATLPLYRRLDEAGQIEAITTPFYHPILPLLIDTASARRADPGLAVPPYSAPQDAAAQLELALAFHAERFGRAPRGLWPAEHAVSPEMVPLLARAGIRWTISDEQVLARSLGVEIRRDGEGNVLNPGMLYRPYRAVHGGGEVAMVFRDHVLSDLIGFEYRKMPGEEAAADLCRRLGRIRDALRGEPGNHLVTIALDGENPWEWYPGDKTVFLHALYRNLSADPGFRAVTVGSYLEENPPEAVIDRLATGSWVDGSLARWIGSPAKNRAWELLADARSALLAAEKGDEADGARAPLPAPAPAGQPGLAGGHPRLAARPPRERRALREAREHLYAAEGSDYTWWLDSMPAHLAAPFDALLRQRLIRLYESLGRTPPPGLSQPLVEGASREAWNPEGPLAMARARSRREEKKMRILMLSWEFPPRIVGGLGRHVYGLSTALAGKGPEVHVVSWTYPGAPARERVGGVEVHRVGDPGLEAPDFLSQVLHFNFSLLEEAVRAWNRAGPFDLVHAHDWLVAHAARTLKHTYRVPLLATIHATEHGRNRGIHTPMQRYIHQVEWWLTYEAWRVITCSRFMRDEVQGLFSLPGDKMDVIPNGVEAERFTGPPGPGAQAVRRRFARDEEKLVFFIGRMVHEKGAHLLVEAAPEVAYRYPAARLVLAGGGPALEGLRARAGELGLAERVFLPGPIDDETRDALYRLADVAAFPSLYEPFGIVALEAMAAGTPVVVADTGGLSEVVDHGLNGIKVSPGDPHSLAEGILQLLQQEDYARELAARALERVTSRYTWDRVAGATLEVYRRVLAEHRDSAWGPGE